MCLGLGSGLGSLWSDVCYMPEWRLNYEFTNAYAS